jgi:peptidoglycan/xylan/chitin deacetylase (PgdA/CDA1 family)
VTDAGRDRDRLDALRTRFETLETAALALDRSLDALIRAGDRAATVAHHSGYANVRFDTDTSRPHRGVVLLYHRVSRLDPDPARLCADPDVFRAHMEYLARRCEPMTLEALVGAAARNGIPRRAVAITFDDGYADALRASDIVRSLGLPATFFVNSSAGGETVLDTLIRIVLGEAEPSTVLEIVVDGQPFRAPCRTRDERRATFNTLNETARGMSADRRRNLVASLREWSCADLPPRPTHRVLTPAELRELGNRPGHAIGGHTENHLILPLQPRGVRLREIAANRNYLEALVGRPISTFAYPYGAFDDETVRICRAMGFEVAVTVASRTLRSWDDPLLVPRYDAAPYTPAQFEAFIDQLHA